MTPQELKNSILQRAIEGRLVEQRAEEGTGAELFDKIQKEKKELIKEGKIKNQKPLPEITEDEVPFEIPKTWKWVRLGEISDYNNVKIKIRPNEISPDTWALDLEDIEKDTGFVIKRNFARDKIIKGERTIFYKGQILYSKLRPYLKKILVAPDSGVCSSELVPFSCFSDINSEFLVYLLKSPYIDRTINLATYGVKMPRVGTDTMVNLVLPIPPLAEQKRIVEKIEELMPLVDEYEENWQKIEEFNQRFPEDMKKSLLQEAIKGKLVEQRKEEGTGTELFDKIQKEKKELIKEGKIKNQKPLPEITEDEIPFDIPETWKWVWLGELTLKITDGAHSTPTYTKEGVPFLSVKDISSGKIDYSDCKFISQEEHEKLFERCNPEKGDLLLTKVGTTGIPVVVETEDEFSLFVSVALLKFPNKLIDIYFLKNLINSPLVQVQAKENTRGVGNKNWVIRDIANTIVPLPPLAEQKRIVDRLEELLPLCDKLIKNKEK